MSVYVDESKWPYRNALYCHMIADTDEELESVARLIGLQPSWRQSPTRGQACAHYDLSPGKRALAVRHGAIECDWRELARIMYPHLNVTAVVTP